MWRTVFAAVLASVALPALAQDATTKLLLAKINQQEPPPAIAAIMPELLSRSQTAARAEKRCVPNAITIDPLAPATASEDAFSQIKTGKVLNVWSTYARAVGCVGALPEHFLIVRLQDKSLRFVGVNAGMTLTSFAQMKSVAQSIGDAALVAATKVDAKCTAEGLDIASTRIVAELPGLGPDFYGVRVQGQWDEAWTIRACARLVVVPVRFTADGRGGVAAKIDTVAIKVGKPVKG